MIRDITIGQFYPTESKVHELDPRTKLFGTFMFLISLFVTNTLSGYVLASIFLIFAIKLSHVPFKFITKGLKAILIVLLISVSFNIFFTSGTTLIKIGFINITREGLKTAFFMAIRLIYLVIGSSLMTLTTTPTALTDGLDKSLGFLNKLKVPVHDISMMMSIALRFIPILVEETDKIMKAQMARGADFDTGNIIEKAKALVPLLVPLFVSAFRRAGDLALAMEARGYHGGEGRTKMKPLRYSPLDYKAYGIFLIYFVLMILSRWI